MNLEHLGDALDHWKGSIIRQLRKNDWLRDFAVEPMLTDNQPWDALNTDVYRRLLELDDNEPILHANVVFSNRTRRGYFTALTHRGDLFLDPDTGIAKGYAKAQHITVEDIHSLFRGDYMEDRTLLVFQHADHSDLVIRIQQIVERVIAPENNLDRDLIGCSYECGRVDMLFFSTSRERLANVQKIFSAFVGIGGRSVIRMWPQQG